MPAFEGLRAIRKQAILHSELSIDQIVSLVNRIDPDANTFDLDASVLLNDIVSQGINCDGIKFYQECVCVVLLNYQPIWKKSISLGRKRFVQKLDRDQQSIFRLSGLLEDPPTDEIVSWWDKITGLIRLETDQKKLDQARLAEKLTLENETKRIMDLGITEKPKWIAIEDNTAGYDVLSYNKNEYGLINKLIEVKSTVASPLRFYLTRNEWDKALEFGDAYFFHVWDMQKSPPVYYEKRVVDIAPHVPQDNEKGKWSSAVIPIGV